MVECIVRLANRMGYRVVAEGVENDWEASCLRELGCHEAQGYYFARPLPEQACGDFLLQHGTLAPAQPAAERQAG